MSKSKWFNNAGSLWGTIGDSFFKIKKNDKFFDFHNAREYGEDKIVGRVNGIVNITDNINESEIYGNETELLQDYHAVKSIYAILDHELHEKKKRERIDFSLSRKDIEIIMLNNSDFFEFSISKNIGKEKEDNEGNIITSINDMVIVRYGNGDNEECLWEDDEYSIVSCAKSKTNKFKR